MNLRELKSESMNRIEQIKFAEGENQTTFGRGLTTIGTKTFSVSFGKFELYTKLESQSGIFDGVLLVDVGFKNTYFGMREESIPSGFTETFAVVKEYWYSYAKMKGHPGVLFVSSELEPNHYKLFTDLTNLLPEEVDIMSYHYKIYGGTLSEKARLTIASFHRKKTVFEEVMKKKPLLSITKQVEDLNKLFTGSVYFNYYGKEFRVRIIKDKNQLEVTLFEEGEVKKVIDSTEEGLLNFLEEIEASQRFAAEFDAPKDNFLRGVEKYHKLKIKGTQEKVFEKLEVFFGDWEEVERRFIELNKVEDVELVNWSDSRSDKKITVYEKAASGYTYYFVNYFQYQGVNTSEYFDIDVWPIGKGKDELKKKITTMMTSHF